MGKVNLPRLEIVKIIRNHIKESIPQIGLRAQANTLYVVQNLIEAELTKVLASAVKVIVEAVQTNLANNNLHDAK